MVFSRDYINTLHDLMPAVIEFVYQADKVNELRCTGEQSKRKGFLTGDFALYYNSGGNVLFHLARKRRNLFFHNLIDAVVQTERTDNYVVSGDGLNQIIGSVGVLGSVRVDMNGLSVERINDENCFVYFDRDKDYARDNPLWMLGQRIFGCGEKSVNAMKMLEEHGVERTKIKLLTIEYVLEHTTEGEGIGRYCRMEGFENDFTFFANCRNINNLLQQLGKFKRQLEEQIRSYGKSPFEDICTLLLSPDSPYSSEQRDRLAIALDGILSLYMIKRSHDALDTIGRKDLQKIGWGYFGKKKVRGLELAQAPLTADLYRLLLGEDSPYNGERKDRLALLVKGVLIRYFSMRTVQTTFIEKPH